MARAPRLVLPFAGAASRRPDVATSTAMWDAGHHRRHFLGTGNGVQTRDVSTRGHVTVRMITVGVAGGGRAWQYAGAGGGAAGGDAWGIADGRDGGHVMPGNVLSAGAEDAGTREVAACERA